MKIKESKTPNLDRIRRNEEVVARHIAQLTEQREALDKRMAAARSCQQACIRDRWEAAAKYPAEWAFMQEQEAATAQRKADALLTQIEAGNA